MEWMANQAGYYARAAQWLEKAELAHEVLGREDDWLCRPTANETLIPLPRRRHRGRSSIGASSPRSSWTPGSWSTPDCRHRQFNGRLDVIKLLRWPQPLGQRPYRRDPQARILGPQDESASIESAERAVFSE
jgi:hypothetical protein